MSPVRYDGGTRGRMRHQNAQHRLLLCCCYCCCHAGMTWLTPEGRDLGVCQTTTETWRLPCDKRRVIGFIDLQPPNCITASAQQQPTYWTTQATQSPASGNRIGWIISSTKPSSVKYFQFTCAYWNDFCVSADQRKYMTHLNKNQINCSLWLIAKV